jgi:hypothetical protein
MEITKDRCRVRQSSVRTQVLQQVAVPRCEEPVTITFIPERLLLLTESGGASGFTLIVVGRSDGAASVGSVSPGGVVGENIRLARAAATVADAANATIAAVLYIRACNERRIWIVGI